MKRFLLILSVVSVSALSAAAQTQDAPFRPGAQPRSENYPDKALSYGEHCGYALDATTTANNGNDGVMFRVKAKNNLIISGFSARLAGGSGYIRIYRKNGNYSGSETFPSAWTLIDSAFVTPVNGQDVFIPVQVGNFLSAGAEMSYYIVGTSTVDVDYLNGTTEGAIYSQNEDLIFFEGIGLNNIFGTVFTPRNFTGKIHYCKQTEIRCDSSSTIFSDLNSNFGIFFDVTAKSRHIKIDNIFADLDLPGGAMLKVYTRDGSFVGNESTPAAWSLVDSNFISFPLPNAPEAVADSMSLIVNANSTRAFLIVFNNTSSGFVSYNNGTAIGNVMFEDSLLQIKTGAGADAPFASNGMPRNFQGTISYCLMEYASLDEDNAALPFSVWPNPAADVLNLNSNGLPVKEVQIMDITGKTVLHIRNFNGTAVPLHSLTRGTYILRALTDQKIFTERFIKM